MMPATSVLDESRVVVAAGPDRAGEKIFEFDRCFGEESTQVEVFKEVEGLVVSALDGYHSCIFAYGQTGSGKTFTMQGSLSNPGIYFRTLDALFKEAERRQSGIQYTFKVRHQYLTPPCFLC